MFFMEFCDDVRCQSRCRASEAQNWRCLRSFSVPWLVSCVCYGYRRIYISWSFLQRVMLICDEEYVMRRIGDACDEYFCYRDDVLYVCSGNGCQCS